MTTRDVYAFSLVTVLLYIGVASSQFILFHKRLSKSHSQHCCEQLGLTLPIVEDETKIELVSKYVKDASAGKPGKKHIWLSLQHDGTNSTKNDHFFWVNNASVSVSFWAEDQPLFVNISKCVILNENTRKWETAPCDDTWPVLCEKQDSSHIPLTQDGTGCPHFTVLKMLSNQTEGRANSATFQIDESQTDFTTRVPVKLIQTVCREDCSAACLNFPLCQIALFTRGNKWNCQLLQSTTIQ